MKTVFVDVDTQFDFMLPAGALYASGAEQILPTVARLNQWAAAQGIVVLSTMDAHSENDPEFRDWPPHCIVGTTGQRKPAATLLDRIAVVSTIPSPVSLAGARQVLVEKQHIDCFTNPNLPAVLEQVGAERYVVYGVVTEYCVRCAAFGLLGTGARVELVPDAVRSLKDEDARRMLEEFRSSGGYVTTAGQVCAG